MLSLWAVGADGTILRGRSRALSRQGVTTALFGSGARSERCPAVGERGTALHLMVSAGMPRTDGTTQEGDVWASGPPDVLIVGDAERCATLTAPGGGPSHFPASRCQNGSLGHWRLTIFD